MNRDVFFEFVRTCIAEDPEAAAHIADHVQAGLRDALRSANERAADMEIAVSVLAARRYKGTDKVLMRVLKKWNGKSALNWDWLIKREAEE